jgi:parallel beta-helix repeat protein
LTSLVYQETEEPETMAFTQPGIFLVNFTAPYTAVRNTQAIRDAIDAAQEYPNPDGAIVVIPSFPYGASGPDFIGKIPVGAATGGSAVITIPDSGYESGPLLICGTGSTWLLMQTPPPGPSGGTVLFEVSDGATVTFQDLTVEFAYSDVPPIASQEGTAFSFRGGANHMLFRVNVINCQYPIALANTTGVSILQCFTEYKEGFSDPYATAPIALQITNATQTSVAQCIMSFNTNSPPVSAEGLIVSGSSFTQVNDTQCNGFDVGVTVQGGPSGTVTIGANFTGCRVSSYGTCITVLPAVFDVSFVDCSCQAALNWPPPSAMFVPGISIGASAGENSQVDTVRFTSCTLVGTTAVSGSAFYGLEIASGQNIQINGGSYSGNGDGAGIAILGGTAIQINGTNCIGLSTFYGIWQLYGIYIAAGENIQLVNVNCSGTGLPGYDGTGIYIAGSADSVQGVQIVGALCTAPVLEYDTPNQEHGIYASGASDLTIAGCTLTDSTSDGIYLENVTNVTVSSCDVSGNAQGIFVGDGSTDVFIRGCNLTPLSTGAAMGFGSSSDLSNVQVTDCAGYNDQPTTTILHGPTSTMPSGIFSGVTYGYYGPTTFYVSGPQAAINIDGTATGLTSGGFTLAPGEYAEIIVGLIPGNFFMVGN